MSAHSVAAYYSDLLSLVVALFGVIVLVVASLQGIVRFVLEQYGESARGERNSYEDIRRIFGEKILLSLEFFVAGDIIRTMITPSFIEIGKLAGIVAIRVVLGYFLGREIDRISDGARSLPADETGVA